MEKPKDILFDNLEDLIQHVSKNNERKYIRLTYTP